MPSLWTGRCRRIWPSSCHLDWISMWSHPELLALVQLAGWVSITGQALEDVALRSYHAADWCPWFSFFIQSFPQTPILPPWDQVNARHQVPQALTLRPAAVPEVHMLTIVLFFSIVTCTYVPLGLKYLGVLWRDAEKHDDESLPWTYFRITEAFFTIVFWSLLVIPI